MMTRETKVGLVVAGSFLCLVGVVVFFKMRDGGAPSRSPAEPEEVVLREDEAGAGEKTAAREREPTGRTAPPPAAGGIVPDPNPNLTPPPTIVTTGAVEPPSPPAPSAPPPPAPPPPEAPPPERGAVMTPPTPPPSASGGTGPAIGESPASPPPPPATDRPPPAGDRTAAPLAAPPPEAPPPTPPPANDPRSTAPAPAVLAPPVAPERATSPGTTVNPGGAAGATLQNPIPSPGVTTSVTPLPPTGASSPTASTNSPPIRVGVDNAPGAARVTPLPAGSAPAAGTPVGVSVPPITVGGPAATAPGRRTSSPTLPVLVESFDEEEYRAKAGDTFASISVQFYRTDKYAPALLLFNRNHPLAAAGIRQEPPVLQPGQIIFIPPTAVLEKRYGSAPVEAAPPAERRSNAPPAPGAAPVSYAQYRIGGEGEMLYDVARRTLNNGDRWPEIHRLNPALHPEMRIAAGTVLTLPPGAAIDPANRP